MRRQRLIAGAFVLSLAACSARQRINTETALAKALISDEQEVQLGQQVQQQLEQKGIRYLNNPAVTDYANSIANRISAVAREDRPGVNWHTYVIDDSKTVNAFAAPGGNVYIYTGLLLAADNEAEVAGVLAHEAGHVVARHTARQLVQMFGLEAIATLALGRNPALAAKLAASIVANGMLLAHSRADENEADEYGARYSSAIGYDPHGLVTFFQKLQAKEGRTPAVLAWLSTHPSTPDRINHVTQFIAVNGLRGSEVGRERLAAIKQQLHNSSARR